MVDIATIGYISFVAGAVIVGGIVLFQVWKAKHPYKIRVRRLTGSNTKVIRDAIGKKKVDKKGIEYIKAYYGIMKKPLPNKLPIPSADVVEYDSTANKMVVEAWYDDVRGFTYVKDGVNVEILNELNDQEGFRTFPTNSREMLINQYNIANSMKPKTTPEVIMYMTPFLALIMILTVFMIFFGKVIEPINASAGEIRQFNIEWMDKARQISDKQAELMGYIVEERGGNVQGDGVIVAPDALG